MRDEQSIVLSAPASAAGERYASGGRAAGTRARPAPDIAPVKESDFLTHWNDDVESSGAECAREDILSVPPDHDPAPARTQTYPPASSAYDRPSSILPPPFNAGHAPASGSARKRLVRWGMAVGGVVLAAALVFLSTGGASLTVSFKPRIDDVALQDIAVAFDTSVGKVLPEQKVIPAEALSFLKSKTQSFPATGRQVITERSRGKAAIINSFSSSPQTLVAGTRFLTPAGILFRMPKSVIVPGAKIEGGKIAPQSVDVELVADAPGERSNITGAVSLKIPGLKGTPKYDGFSAIADKGFSGGMQGSAPVVSADDLKNAEEQVTKAIFDDLRAEITGKIPPGFTALKELQNIEITKVTAPAVGTHTEQFSVSADAGGRVIIFREEDAMALVRAFALTDTGQQELVDGSGQLQYHARSIDFDKGRAAITIGGSIKIKAVVHRDELASLVAGKKEGSITDVLRGRPEFSSFNISIFPPWRASAPANPAKIRFQPE